MTTRAEREQWTPVVVKRLREGDSIAKISQDTGFDKGTIRRWWMRATNNEPLPKRTRRVPIPHGTPSGWSWHKCKCGVCMEAKREYKAREYQRAKAREVKPEEHGTHTGRWHGCKCQACRQVNIDQRQGQQERTREHASSHFKRWSAVEDDVAFRTDLTTEEKALMLGRTFAAVENRLRWWQRRNGRPWQERGQ